MQNQLIGFFIITTVAFAGLSAVQWKRSARYQAHAETMRSEASDQAYKAGMHEAEVRSLQRRIEQLTDDTSALAEMVQSLMDTTNTLTEALASQSADRMPKREAGENAGAAPAPAGLGMLSKLLEDPAMAEAMRSQQRMAMHMMYGDLFKQLPLAPEETKHLQELLLDMQMLDMKLGTRSVSGDETTRDGDLTALREEKDRKLADVLALLGEENFGKYEAYRDTMGERMMARQFQEQLSGVSQGLQPDQYDRLVAIMVEEKLSSNASMGMQNQGLGQTLAKLGDENFLAREMARQQAYYDRILDNAQEILTPEQLLALEEFQRNQMKMMQLGAKMALEMRGESVSASVVPAPVVVQ